MKKVATITFHSSHNYGSNLQAYALQEYIKSIANGDIEYKIINLRKPIQKEMYKNVFELKGLKNRIKQLILYRYKKDLRKKQDNFENFIETKLNITKEYSSLDSLKKANLDFDYYISGGDQPWNLQAKDFDWAYFLEFVKKGKKISYSVSFGPKAQNWNDEELKRLKKDLKTYDYISVRERGSFDNVKKILNKEPYMHVDPTMLLKKSDWEKLIDKKPILNKEYILLYDLKVRKEDIILVKELAKKIGLPVIITRHMSFYVHFCSGFEKHYYCGPLEFLNLLKNAKLVLSSSFHGTVFSILLHKPFLAINGDKDFRINTLLEKMKLENRILTKENMSNIYQDLYNINFKEADKLLEKERKESEEYLKCVLDIKN